MSLRSYLPPLFFLPFRNDLLFPTYREKVHFVRNVSGEVSLALSYHLVIRHCFNRATIFYQITRCFDDSNSYAYSRVLDDVTSANVEENLRKGIVVKF